MGGLVNRKRRLSVDCWRAWQEALGGSWRGEGRRVGAWSMWTTEGPWWGCKHESHALGRHVASGGDGGLENYSRKTL